MLAQSYCHQLLSIVSCFSTVTVAHKADCITGQSTQSLHYTTFSQINEQTNCSVHEITQRLWSNCINYVTHFPQTQTKRTTSLNCHHQLKDSIATRKIIPILPTMHTQSIPILIAKGLQDLAILFL